jgi:diguanylate cyclase (GGDEF)-like protein/PAS domain S-box-containing protein
MGDRIARFVAWWPQQNIWRYLWVPVTVSILASEAIVAVTNLLLLGRVDGSYLLVGLITSGPVSLGVCAALFYLANRIDRGLEHEYGFRQTIIDSIPGAFYLFDLFGRFLMWNHNLEAVLGLEAEEMAASRPLDFFDEQDRPSVERAIREVFERGVSAVEATLVAKDGTRTPFYFNGYRVELEGRPTLLGIGLDITERKHAEAELLEAKDRLALALEASALSIWDFDINSGIVYLDGRWAAMIGGLPGVTIVPAKELLENTHPEDRDRVIASALNAFKGTVAFFQEEFRFKTVAGDWKWIRCAGKVAERDPGGRAIRAIGTNLDNTERKAAEDRIHQLAYYDSLTGLPNRSLLMDRLNQALSQAKRFGRSLAVMFLDLDDFKKINDTLGHMAGDELLKLVAQRLVGCIRTGDTISRQGGDEFVVVLAEIAQPGDAARVAEKIVDAMTDTFEIAGKALSITVSIGISVYPINGTDDLQELMKKADIAMYAAKRAGRNRYEFHAPALSGS